ncbi:anthrone oxygenase family protein [Streptomyces sp. BE133]|uniref:anthrone oxygenase family protein n=1 Tax=Streptomyces sp. BE133 TaxID=3002523 RepID=UPI003FA748DD
MGHRPVVLGAVWAVLAWGGEGASLVVAGAVLLVVMAILLFVPINSRVATWSHEGAPADWKQQMGRWDRFHHVRVSVIVLAFALFTVALVQRPLR